MSSLYLYNISLYIQKAIPSQMCLQYYALPKLQNIGVWTRRAQSLENRVGSSLLKPYNSLKNEGRRNVERSLKEEKTFKMVGAVWLEKINREKYMPISTYSEPTITFVTT